ncbi:MAG TPA: hypothetical protein VMT19_00800 [Thermoanaerobaculaceae bacterium]|nr:hypothetical protein [Thermoanaerobaculaceae bacterium]
MNTERKGHVGSKKEPRARYEKPEVKFVELRPEVLQAACGKTAGSGGTCRGNPHFS